MRTAPSKARTVISSARSQDALLMRARADFDDLAAYRRFIDEIVSRRNARNAKRIDIERAELQASAGPAHLRLRGGQRPRHLLGRLHAAQGVLHRALAPDRPSAAGAPLRRSARPVHRRHPAHDAAARARPCHRQARPGRRLSACHPFAAPQADGAAQPRLSRPAVSARGLPANLRRAA